MGASVPTTRARRSGRRRGGVRALALLVGLSLVLGGALWRSGLWPTVTAQIKATRWDSQTPTGADHLTARMRAVRNAITTEFDIPGGVGCYREEGGVAGGGEHPLGRACDFMLGPAGVRATGSADRLGDEIVRWVRAHADDYGIWYVIYEQHIWSSRFPHRGWKPMEDRGSVTQNHYDHVHISVY